MSSIDDLWWGEVPDPDRPGKKRRVKKAGYGKGMRYKVRWYPPGAERQTSKSFPDGKKRDADAFKTYIDNSMLDRKYVDPAIGKKSFAWASDQWLKGTSTDPQTRNINKTQLNNHILPFFKSYTIERAAQLESVRGWLEWLDTRRTYGRPLSEFYRVLLFRQLASIFKLALAEKWITDSPCRSTSLTKPKAPKRLVVPWSKERLDSIWAALPERNKIVVPLGAGQGLRRGEILGFSPDDIDRGSMVLNVNRQIRRLPGGVRVFSLPKGDKTRQAPLSPWVLKQIDAYMELFPPTRIILPWKTADGHPETVDLLMVREDGLSWYGELFHATVWAGAFRKSGLVQRRRVDGEHAMRHLFASNQLAGGVSVRELAEYLGHADPATTLRVYTHLITSSAPRSRAATDLWFDPDFAAKTQIRPEAEFVDDGSLFGDDGEIVDLD